MENSTTKSKLKYLSPDQIEINPENPRMIFRQDEMENLLLSIKMHGIQVPVAVYRDGEKYHLLDGERRWRCALKLNLKEIPALIQEKPSPLQNLLLMYNIHSLREQWDYFTIAKSLSRIIELFEKEKDYRPNEVELSKETGLTRGQIRRCNLIIELPDKYKVLIEKELQLPKFKQKITEDFFIEMERSLKTIFRRMDEFSGREDEVRDALIMKYRTGVISAVTDFRMLSKIATAVSNIGLKHKVAKDALEKIFDPKSDMNIKRAYSSTVEFEYDEKKAKRYLDQLNQFFDDVIEDDGFDDLDEEFISELRALKEQINTILGEIA